MAGLDEVLERLVSDRDFRTALQQDPLAALAGYDLSEDERDLLAAQLTADAGTGGSVEQRTSKSGMAGLLEAIGSLGAQTPDEHVSTWNFKNAWPSKFEVSDPDAFAAPVQEPEEIGYLKLGDIKGETAIEADDPEWRYIPVRRFDEADAQPSQLAAPEQEPEEIGLLLPAVQKVPSAAESGDVAGDLLAAPEGDPEAGSVEVATIKAGSSDHPADDIDVVAARSEDSDADPAVPGEWIADVERPAD